MSLPFLSVRETRERLEALPLVKSASVRKLYPDELVVTLVERDAHALWQKNGELFIIAADGTVVDTFDDAALRLSAARRRRTGERSTPGTTSP